MDTFREDLQLYLGSAYNNQKTMNSYGSANGLIDEMINIIFTLIEKRIDSIYIKHPNTAGIGHNECLDQIKREMLK